MATKEVDKQAIADRLKKLVKALGYENPREMSMDMGYERPDNLYNAMNGDRMPGIPLLIDISNRFKNANVIWVLTGKGEPLLEGVLELQEGEKGYRKKSGLYERPDYLPTLLKNEIEVIRASLDKLSQAASKTVGSSPVASDPVQGLPLGRKKSKGPAGSNKDQRNTPSGNVSKKGN
jgi:hypothetical protein